ncbi:MAG: hypothetical protein ACAI43_03435 [Phycisphaerae bacterium]|nr:hypothetical protein [Tepidisphaeraceae bacterium]
MRLLNTKLLAGAVVALATMSASANSIFLTYAGAANNGPNIDYSYRATLDSTSSPTSTMQTDDYFVIFDFAGYTGGFVYTPASGLTAADFSIAYFDSSAGTQLGISTSAVVGTGTKLLPTSTIVENTTTKDLFVQYVGTTTLTAQLDLGLFTFTSTVNKVNPFDAYGARDHKGVAFSANQGEVLAPTVDLPNAPDVVTPLPGVAMGGMALMGFGLMKFRRVRLAA